jgi:hypothetical protein
MEQEFGISNYMAKNANKLQEDKGPMTFPDQKKAGNELPTATVKAVLDYYNLDEASQAMPGKKELYLSQGLVE